MKAFPPVLTGLIDRRVLINFRVAPEIAAQRLPAPFRPRLVAGWALAGICVIRLREIRPAFLPAALGLASENAAHRIAVEWDEGPAVRAGVYIARRDTNSRCNQFLGGRLFPGAHHYASFWSAETESRLKAEARGAGRGVLFRIAARLEGQWPSASVFTSMREASEFFRTGGPGWSLDHNGDLEGLELRVGVWDMKPLTVEVLESSFFSQPALFPPNKIQFDSALLMRETPHEWRALGKFSNAGAAERAARNRHGPHALFEMP